MAVDERSRHELYLRLEQTLGTTEADTLMSMLPPVGWADVATKQDLDQLERRLRAELTADFRLAILEQTRTMLFGMVASVFTAVSLTYAAVRLG